MNSKFAKEVTMCLEGFSTMHELADYLNRDGGMVQMRMYDGDKTIIMVNRGPQGCCDECCNEHKDGNNPRRSDGH